MMMPMEAAEGGGEEAGGEEEGVEENRETFRRAKRALNPSINQVRFECFEADCFLKSTKPSFRSTNLSDEACSQSN